MLLIAPSPSDARLRAVVRSALGLPRTLHDAGHDVTETAVSGALQALSNWSETDRALLRAWALDGGEGRSLPDSVAAPLDLRPQAAADRLALLLRTLEDWVTPRNDGLIQWCGT